MIPLPVLEEIIDRFGVAPRIELLLPIGVRARQLLVHTLLLGMLIVLADHRPAHRHRGWLRSRSPVLYSVLGRQQKCAQSFSSMTIPGITSAQLLPPVETSEHYALPAPRSRTHQGCGSCTPR
jgi:hypothetical protein